MGQREDHMIMVTRQEPRLLPRQPALDLKIRTLRTRPMPTRVVPDTCDVAVGARLDMAAQRGGPTLHERACSSADVERERMRLLVGGKRVLEDGLERHEGYRCLCTSGIRASSGCFVQYHANYPRCKRLVQRDICHTWLSDSNRENMEHVRYLFNSYRKAGTCDDTSD